MASLILDKKAQEEKVPTVLVCTKLDVVEFMAPNFITFSSSISNVVILLRFRWFVNSFF